MGGEVLVGKLPKGWEYTTLGEACKRGGGGVQTGPFGSQLHAADYVPHGIPSIMPQNIGDNRVVCDGIARITAEDAMRLKRYLVRPGDIVYSRRGDVERRALIREAEDGWLCGTGCLRVRFAQEYVDSTFASYYFGDSRVREWVVRHAHDATMPNLNTGILSALPFVVPPLPEQRAIAHILGTLDDKIELNRRMNETLEAMARALFKSWFVDFDPVRAKMEGRDPNLPKPLANLFPDSFQDSERGKIPKGWEVRKLGDLMELTYGKALKAEDRKPGTVPVYGSNGQVGWNDESLVTGPGIIVGRKGNPGVVIWAPTDFYAIDTTFYVVPTKNCHSLYFLFHALKLHDLALLGADSAVPGLNRNMAYMNLQVLPPTPLLDKFDSYACAIALRINQSNEESRTLAALRDTLLSKLISGELRVPEGSIKVGNHT